MLPLCSAPLTALLVAREVEDCPMMDRIILGYHNVTPIGLKLRQDFFLKISFLVAKEEQQPPYGVPTRVRGAPAPWGALRECWTKGTSPSHAMEAKD